jgi:hypothetical protein
VGATAGRGDEPERLRSFLENLARELWDEVPLAAIITRNSSASSLATIEGQGEMPVC